MSGLLNLSKQVFTWNANDWNDWLSMSQTSLDFTDSNSDYISVSNHADLQIDGEDFSVSFWIKLTEDATSTSNKDGIIGIKAGQFRQGGFWFEYVDDAGDDQHISLFTSTNSAKTELRSTGDAIAYNTWYHVVATYDLSTTTSTLYINGSVSKSSTSHTAPTAYTGTVGIGTYGTYVSCQVRDVALWKGIPLTGTEVAAMYNAKLSPSAFHPHLLKGHWKLVSQDKTGADNVFDYSLNGHHGTTTNLVDADFKTTSSPTGV